MTLRLPLPEPPSTALARPAATPTPSALDVYQPQFDGLRALAVLVVIFDHFTSEIPDFPLPDSIHLGATGVRLFLVMSGYFITGSLRRARERIEAGKLTAAKAGALFYCNRVVRVLPAYTLFVVVGVALNLGTMRANLPWLLTGTVNFLIARTALWPVTISHLWSICVQEQFYLLWPALILLLPRRRVLPAIVAAGLAGIGFRVGCVAHAVSLPARWVLPFGSLDSLAAGAIVGWTRWQPPVGQSGRILAAAVAWGLLMTAGILRNSDPTRYWSVWVEPSEAAAMAYLVARTGVGFDGIARRVLTWPVMIYAGQLSYGIYIYHILVAVCVERWLPGPWRVLIGVPFVRLATLGGVTLAVAAASWHWVEEPIKRWRPAR